MNDVQITTKQLAGVLDLTEKRIGQLQTAAVIPPSIAGRVPLIGSVQGYLKFLRGSKSDDLSAARLRKLLADAEISELELAEKKGDLKSVDQIAKELGQIGYEIRAALIFELTDQMPFHCAGCDAPKIREYGEAAIQKIFKRWREWCERQGEEGTSD